MDRDTFFRGMAEHLPAYDLPGVQMAYWLAKEGHRPQVRRLTGERYFEHVRRVSWMVVVKFRYRFGSIASLALLHDVIEDTFTPAQVIPCLFGSAMYRNAMALSKEFPSYDMMTGEVIGRAKKNDDEYYAGLEIADPLVRIVKGADRCDNLVDLPSWEPARKQKYITETETRILPLLHDLPEIKSEVERLLDLAA